MEDLEEIIWLYRMNSSIAQKKRVMSFGSLKGLHKVPTENCRHFMDAWLQCIDTKDNCCGGNKCKFFFQEWQNCHRYNDKVNRHNRAMFEDNGEAGTFNGLSSK